jgi:hypothetical protein
MDHAFLQTYIGKQGPRSTASGPWGGGAYPVVVVKGK